MAQATRISSEPITLTADALLVGLPAADHEQHGEDAGSGADHTGGCVGGSEQCEADEEQDSGGHRWYSGVTATVRAASVVWTDWVGAGALLS